MLDRRLGSLCKALQQPRQGNFQPHMIVCHIDLTVGRLAKRTNAKHHAIAFPAFLVDVQHRHTGRRARKPGLETANGFVASEAMRNGNNQWR